MAFSEAVKAVTIVAAVACLATGAAVPAQAAEPIEAASSAAAKAPTRHEHSVSTHPLQGKFRCGDLLLTVTGGTETETTDGDLRNGVAHVSINRVWHRVTLSGSDGRTYRAVGFTLAWFVLEAPHFNKPVRGREMIQVVFRGGPDKSPGYLRENIKITDRHETDGVSGPCDYAD